MSSQACGAYAPLRAQDADGTETTGMTYWNLKNRDALKFTTGYRIYLSADTELAYTHAYGEETTYSMVDHGYVAPPPAEETADDATDDSMSGASALFTATAAVFATFLMF